jgi:hypothetical protein
VLAIAVLAAAIFTTAAMASTDGSLPRLGEAVAERGVPKTISPRIGLALGLGGGIEGAQESFTNMRGEGRVVLVCEMAGRQLVVLAHLNPQGLGPIWLTSDTGVLERTALKDAAGARQVDNAAYFDAFEAEKRFFLALRGNEPAAASGRWPSCITHAAAMRPSTLC